MAGDMWGAMACWPVATTWPTFVPIAGAPSRNNCWRNKPEVILMAGYEAWQCRRHAGRPGCVGETVRQRLQRLCRPSGLERAACGEGGSPRGLSRRHPQHHGCRPHRVLARPSIRTSSRISPLATYQAFYQHYLPIRPQGTFMLGIQTQDDAS